jgi:hypothetical protein
MKIFLTIISVAALLVTLCMAGVIQGEGGKRYAAVAYGIAVFITGVYFVALHAL